MRKILVTEYLTLDGVFEEPGHWSFEYFNDEAMQYKRDELFSSDVQLLGRVTYEGFAKVYEPTLECIIIRLGGPGQRLTLAV